MVARRYFVACSNAIESEFRSADNPAPLLESCLTTAFSLEMPKKTMPPTKIATPEKIGSNKKAKKRYTQRLRRPAIKRLKLLKQLIVLNVCSLIKFARWPLDIVV